ncbi:hypothetical protein [Acidithiobacillus ferriphilus]|uniref:hypothetical protein n=1 Tax=Acidithiobacillus ferriphilus TaxID=1689834 RepID=UPI002DB7786B|nr:hypothetical protein [Acidithiobacillus ferriphilus]MEB8475410.1 hypothetical protein [Acidithiobacillus ferriphilus]MEB8535380.1 hypothetical protein [Acidithiobacillus ferriphilus]
MTTVSIKLNEAELNAVRENELRILSELNKHPRQNRGKIANLTDAFLFIDSGERCNCVFLKSVTMTCEIDDDEDEEVKQGQGDFLDALRDLCGEAVTIS